MFHSREQFEDSSWEQRLDVLLTSPDVMNLYMFLEAVEWLGYWGLCSDFLTKLDTIQVQQVVETKQARGLSTVEPSFLDGLYEFAFEYPVM